MKYIPPLKRQRQASKGDCKFGRWNFLYRIPRNRTLKNKETNKQYRGTDAVYNSQGKN